MTSTPDSELEYLTPGFDPATLTVARLRNILVSHDINYPSSAKKPQLIEIFLEKVVPQSRKILSSQARIRRTSKGITDVDSSQDSTVIGAEDVAAMPPPAVPATPRRKASKKSAKASAEESADDAVSRTVSTKKTPGRKSSSKHARGSDTDTATASDVPRTAGRKSRKSEGLPQMKVEEADRTMRMGGGDDSVFSYDNPFQSGSSPLSGDNRAPSADHRRTSAGPSTSKEATRRKSSAVRRKTGDYQTEQKPKAEDGVVVPTSRTFEIPVASLRTGAGHGDDGVPAGEDFTPEARMELTREQLKNGAREAMVPRPRRTAGHTGRVSRTAPWVLILTLLGGYATWWRREKLDIGYCGVGHAPTSASIANVQVPDWASFLQPECEPCPQHAYCYPNLETRCEADFVLKPHPLSLGGVIPLAPTCEPDGEKVRKVKAVADRAVEELREQRAKYECGDAVDENGKAAPSKAQMDEEVLKKEVGKKRRKGMSESEFEDLWKGALDDILERDEVVSDADGITGQRTLSSTSLARLPLSCAARRSARLALARYRIELGGLVLVGLIISGARQYLRSLNDAKARVPELVKMTLDRLATQAALHVQDPRAVPEPWVLVGQLRDDVLRDEFSPQRRENLWQRVRAVVEVNANVRASVKETRGGEVGRVWEWIGSVGSLEDAWSTSRRESGRISWGGRSSSSSSPMLTPTPDESRQEMVERRGWQEGRPIY